MTRPSAEQLMGLARDCATPFYVYNLDFLRRTLKQVENAAAVNPKFRVHYAMKACNDPRVLECVRSAGLGVDTVSGGEIELALEAGFDPAGIMFAGVAKTDREIDLALEAGIGCFNVESLQELEVISARAQEMGTVAQVALRINPDIDAHTHHYITTGLAENKFGINMGHLDTAVDAALSAEGVHLKGLHFHIGSQITVTEPFRILCERVNGILDSLRARGIGLESINVGGGLPIDYENPDAMPDFAPYFDTINRYLNTDGISEVHFELGRSIVGQCGTLVSRVVFVKPGDTRTFAILDAGMTELIRPALYGAVHPINNLSGESRGEQLTEYDIVGPVCESTDTFAESYPLAAARRGDIIAIGSAGAYGQTMSGNYNMRHLEATQYIE